MYNFILQNQGLPHFCLTIQSKKEGFDRIVKILFKLDDKPSSIPNQK
jgi:hypothetical protein